MIEMPDATRRWDYENGYYLTCDSSRIGKCLAHYELVKLISDVPGCLIECGVFKGASLLRFVALRDLLMNDEAMPILGFDTFGSFPKTTFAPDAAFRDDFTTQAGAESIGVDQLETLLALKNAKAVSLIPGDINVTVPQYVADHPELRIALIHLDTDIFEPAKTVLEHLYPLLVPGGVLALDDFGSFPGETAAVEEYFAGMPLGLRRFPFSASPTYLIKK